MTDTTIRGMVKQLADAVGMLAQSLEHIHTYTPGGHRLIKIVAYQVGLIAQDVSKAIEEGDGLP